MISHRNIIIIPSRLNAKRLPRKPLININGIPMIIRVYNQAIKANIGKVMLAGCDNELEELAYHHN